MGQPFIVTAEMPGAILAWADGLRRAHFPPERNHLRAHVTLFHAFAPSLRDELRGMLGTLARDHPPPPARIDGLMNLGRGTALNVVSPALLAIRAEIAERFHGALTAQDQAPKRLHITIQNKVAPEVARDLQRTLEGSFAPRDFAFPGLGLHLYMNPHWDAQGVWPFRGKQRG